MTGGWRPCAAVAGGVLVPSAAHAHPMPGVSDFYAGMLHPIVTVEFVIPLVALGLLAGQQGRGTALALLLAVPMALVVGAAAGLGWSAPFPVPWLNNLSIVMCGIALAGAWLLPRPVAVAIGVLPALTVGWLNGAEIDESMSAFRFVGGVALVGFIVIVCGVGGLRRLEVFWKDMAVRVLGSWIAAVGILVLGLGSGPS